MFTNEIASNEIRTFLWRISPAGNTGTDHRKQTSKETVCKFKKFSLARATDQDDSNFKYYVQGP